MVDGYMPDDPKSIHRVLVEVERTEVTSIGQTHTQTVETGATVKCGCGFTAHMGTREEAGSVAQAHLWDMAGPAELTPRQVEDAAVRQGTIEILLAE